MLDKITNVIVLTAAICVALTNIYNFFKRPADAIKEKSDGLKQKEAEQLTEAITDSVMEKVEPLIKEIKYINLSQSEAIELLREGQLDLLRQQILYLYQHHCDTSTLSKDEMEQLHKLYNNYTLQGGNSFVESLYNEMKSWRVSP